MAAHRKHGHWSNGAHGSSEYYAWGSMKSRCYNPADKGFRHYGARGIFVCERWRDSFANFLADMGQRPPGKTLGRIDNDGPYSPENCRWETLSQQNRNKRNNPKIEWRGRSLTAVEWSEELGVSHALIRLRLARGWSVEATLTTKPLSGRERAEARWQKRTALYR